MMNTSIEKWEIIALAILFSTLAYLSISHWLIRIRRKKAADEGKTKQDDERLMAELKKQPWAKKEFRETIIHNTTCLYHERKDDVVIFLKIKKGRVRIGKLFNFYTRSKKLDTFIINLDSLEVGDSKYEAFGVETGYIFREVAFADFSDWKTEYEWLEQTIASSKLGRKAMDHISLEEYIRLLCSKNEN